MTNQVTYRCSVCGLIATGTPEQNGTKHMITSMPPIQHKINPDGSVSSSIPAVYVTRECGEWVEF